GEYVVGQVVDSLCPGEAAAARPLARLFSGAAAPPVLVAVPRVSVRQRPRPRGSGRFRGTGRDVQPNGPALGGGLGNCALEQADEEEELKKFQSKEKQKTRTSHIITRSVANADTGITGKQKKERNEAEETIKNRRTVFVGNLPVNCTAQVCERKVHPNMKYINAYVVFKEECDAVKALKKNGTQIASGFHIRVDLASQNSSVKSSILLLLPADISDEAVREHFADCGDIVAVRIVRDRQTGMGKGFGYILFENTDAVQLALKLNNSDLMGRKVRVKRCVEKGKAQQQNPNQARRRKDRANIPSKPKRYSSDSFVGEKATPQKKNTKTKRLRSITKKKTGKNK
uniref:RNA binding motif protein 34 n=1 Tax=Nothoprocta perdicaria TaxID=30464 RepID=A0A8C6Z6V1_NOTPE